MTRRHTGCRAGAAMDSGKASTHHSFFTTSSWTAQLVCQMWSGGAVIRRSASKAEPSNTFPESVSRRLSLRAESRLGAAADWASRERANLAARSGCGPATLPPRTVGRSSVPVALVHGTGPGLRPKHNNDTWPYRDASGFVNGSILNLQVRIVYDS